MKMKHISSMTIVFLVIISLFSIVFADIGAYVHYGNYLVTTWIPELGTFAYYDMEYNVYLKWTRNSFDYPTDILGAGIEFTLLGIPNFDPVQFAYYTDGIAHRLDRVGVITNEDTTMKLAINPDQSYTNGCLLNVFISFPTPSPKATAADSNDTISAKFDILNTVYIVTLYEPFKPQMLVNLVK